MVDVYSSSKYVEQKSITDQIRTNEARISLELQ